MKTLKKAFVLAVIMWLPSSLFIWAEGSDKGTTNAALRYWMAFALVENPSVDKTLAELLDKTASGEAPWNEERLGPILDQNTAAIETLHRATRLPDCSWGLETELGPDTPIPHLARGRALARLNVLYGMRLVSRGQSGLAVDAWLSGLRFAQDLAREGSLISALVATSALDAHYKALQRFVESGNPNPALRTRIRSGLRGLPAYGVDWQEAWRAEGMAIEVLLLRMETMNPSDAYKQLVSLLGDPMAANPEKSRQDLAAKVGLQPIDLSDSEKLRKVLRQALQDHRRLMEDIIAAYRLPHREAEIRLTAIAARRKTASVLLRSVFPSPTRANELRGEAETHRTTLLNLLG